MHFELIEEHRMLQELVARFVRENSSRSSRRFSNAMRRGKAPI